MRRPVFPVLSVVSALAVVSLLNGCVYSNVRTPYGYLSATPADVKAAPADPAVTGRGCNHSVLFLVAWGNGGYAAAARDALKDHPGAILYDVKSDIHATAALFGLYTRQCTVVTGKAGAP
jgi:hypothetical protein